ncbi:MAG: FHA domain-containing protein [Deltaproteobacteria bacterium]|nr:FHA domain-containing protein [Deltaproteobacteria bacterium]
MARLTIFREGQAVMEHTLPKPIIALGRHTDNDIVLDDLALSRFHARLEQRNDRYIVVDLGSQNGVYVNGVRIEKEQPLKPGDRIGIGRYVAVYEPENGKGRGMLEPGSTEPSMDPAADDDVAGVPYLVLSCNGAEMERFPLVQPEYAVGRSHKCDIVIGLLGLSRRHARVFRTDDGDWAVEDLGSQNGTFVNDVRIEGTHLLADGDVLNFFEYALTFEDQENLRTGPEVTAPQLGGPGDAPSSTMVEDQPEGLSDAIGGPTDSGPSDDQDAESLAAGFESGETEMERGLPPEQRQKTRSTTDGIPLMDEPPPAGAGPAALWPSDREVEDALTLSSQLSPAGLLEVRVDNRLLTEVPLDKAALRIGSDARCDVALPPLTAISGWHLVVVRMGATVLLSRVGDAPIARVGGRPMAQAFLREGDRVELGRVSLVYRRR